VAGRELATNIAKRRVRPQVITRVRLEIRRAVERAGIQVTALCPGFVATDMTDWVEGQVPKEEMIQPEDCAEVVRSLLRLSPAARVPVVVIERAGDDVV